MKRWRLTIFPGIRFSGVSCSCIGRLVPGVSQPLFLSLSLMYQRLGQLATSGKRLQQLCDIFYIYTFQFTETYTFTSKCAFQNFPVDLYCPHFRQSETVIVSELKKEVSNRGSETFNFCPDNSSTMFAFVGRRSASLSSHEISLRSGNDFVQVMGVFPPPLKGAKIMGDFLIHCVSFGADQIAGNRIFHSFPYSSQFHQCTPTVA